MILASEEVITATLISVTTAVILNTAEVITSTLKIISATTNVILATKEAITHTLKII